MYLLPSPSLHHQEICVIGDVRVDPLAVIAPGVVLHAEPGSQIHVAAGVCIGMNSVLHIGHGLLTLETGANLSTGVLIVGAGHIGQNTCIGAGTTVINPNIPAGQVIPPASLLGDGSRQLDLAQVDLPQEDLILESFETSQSQSPDTPHLTNGFTPASPTPLKTPETPPETVPEAPDTASDQAAEAAPEIHGADPAPAQCQNRPIYGQDYVKQMMGKMFPNHSG